MGEPRELAESTLSVARFTILCCKMMPHLDRVLPAHCEIEQLPLDPSIPGDVMADKWCTRDAFLLEFALASFHDIPSS